MGLLNNMENMSWSDLYQMRFKHPTQQDLIAPYEHRAYAREYAQENPVMAGVSLPFTIPAYSLYKLLGLGSARSKPSWEEIKQGYIGLGEGLLGR